MERKNAGAFKHLSLIHILPGEAPSDEEITELWEEADMPDHIRAHCRAVSRECEKIQESLASAGHLLSQEELRAAALLHDLCRQSGRGHEKLSLIHI